MGTSDTQNLKSEAEILARQSRPQRSSTWIPKTRDWRYATGVIQHDDFDDAPKSRTVWDTLDYDYRGGEERDTQATSRRDSTAGCNLGAMEAIDAVHTPNSTRSKTLTVSPRIVTPQGAHHKPMTLPKGGWIQVKRLKRSTTADEDIAMAKYETTALIIRLHFRREIRPQVRDILGRSARSPTSFAASKSNMTPPASSPDTPATARTAEIMRTPHRLDSIQSLHAFPLFKRAWVDETRDFNAAAVRSKIRPLDRAHDELGDNYHWYKDAVPADAVLPPGVPISAKEISAFYPHHVRWKGVMVRLTKNDFRGQDIMGMQAHFRGAPDHETLPSHMNNYQRDAVKTSLPGFKTSGYKGKSDRNLRTDDLVPGPYIESSSKGYTLPSFEDLVRGLHRLPSGLDARGLTTCVSWYLNVRDTFTPKLELNVLHTQALIRALREPLKPFGPQNLDRNALEEWRSKRSFETVEIEHNKRQQQSFDNRRTRSGRSQMHLNLDEEDVSMKLTLPLRHVMTFPFLALHGVVAEALKLGIEKAEVRRTSKEEAENQVPKEDVDTTDATQPITPTSDITPEPYVPEKRNEPQRIPKRPLPIDIKALSSHKKLNISTDPRSPIPTLRPLAPVPLPESGYSYKEKFNIPTGPRSPFPAFLPHGAAHPPGGAFRNRTWMNPALLAGTGALPSLIPPPPPPPPPPAQHQGNLYDRRQSQERRSNWDSGTPYRPYDGLHHRDFQELRPDWHIGTSSRPEDERGRGDLRVWRQERDDGRSHYNEDEYERRDFQARRPDRGGGSSYRHEDGYQGEYPEQPQERDDGRSYRHEDGHGQRHFQERSYDRYEDSAFRPRDGYDRQYDGR